MGIVGCDVRVAGYRFLTWTHWKKQIAYLFLNLGEEAATDGGDFARACAPRCIFDRLFEELHRLISAFSSTFGIAPLLRVNIVAGLSSFA